MEGEKKRAPNFSLREKTVLLNILHKFKHIIENKKTNSQFWREKDAAWQKVTDMFNAQTPEKYPRSKDALRKFYDNLKKNVRKEVADEKKEIFKTGGGVVQSVPNPIKDLALGLMNAKTVHGVGLNKFDSDQFINSNHHDSSDDPENECEKEDADAERDHNYCRDQDVTQVTLVTEPLDGQSTSFASPSLLSANIRNTEQKKEETNNVVPSTSKVRIMIF